MTDILSYKQLYTELENLNTNICDAIYNEDFEEFNNIINEFIATGIPKQKRFSTARQAFRLSRVPILINGVWYGYGSKVSEILDPYIFHTTNGLTLKDIRQRHDYENYVYMVQAINPTAKPKKRKSAEQKDQENFELYLKMLSELYNITEEMDSDELITNEADHQNYFIEKVKSLVDQRKKTCYAFNFEYTNEVMKLKKLDTKDKKDFTDKDKKDKKELTEKRINILQEDLSNLRKISKFDIKNPLFIYPDDTNNILFSNYLQGKYIDRCNWKYYKHRSKLPGNILFYLELAFYLSLSCSNEIENFLNLHCYSIKTEMLLPLMIDGKYYIRGRDICRWADAGVDYNVLNSLFGFELEIKEVKKTKKKKEQEEQKQEEE